MKNACKKGIKRGAIALLSFWLVIFFWQTPVVYPQQTLERNPQEIRGIWMTDAASALMYTSTRTDEVLANLAKHHLNTLYPAVWDRGYTLYPNDVTQQAGGTRGDRVSIAQSSCFFLSRVFTKLAKLGRKWLGG